MLYIIAWLLLWPVRQKCRATGLENLKGVFGHPCIVIANHVDIFDPWKIGIQMPLRQPIHWVAKKELTSFRANYRECTGEYGHSLPVAAIRSLLTVMIVSLSLTIPTTRQKKSAAAPETRQLYRLLKMNQTIGIFPEGGLGTEEVKNGFFRLAQKTGAVIVPVKIQQGWHVQFLPPLEASHCSRDQHDEHAEMIMSLILSK